MSRATTLRVWPIDLTVEYTINNNNNIQLKINNFMFLRVDERLVDEIHNAIHI